MHRLSHAHQLRNSVYTWHFWVFYLELSHRVGQALRAACAGDETNRDFWEAEATVVRCEDQITLCTSISNRRSFRTERNLTMRASSKPPPSYYQSTTKHRQYHVHGFDVWPMARRQNSPPFPQPQLSAACARLASPCKGPPGSDSPAQIPHRASRSPRYQLPLVCAVSLALPLEFASAGGPLKERNHCGFLFFLSYRRRRSSCR